MIEKPKKWQGRFDGNAPEMWRWHQGIQLIENQTTNNFIDFNCIIGFKSDEGVRRNLGRIGAADGPEVLRTFCSNFPYNTSNKICDIGNVVCEGSNLEKAQAELSEQVQNILQNKGKSIVFGGGHEVLFGHFEGIRKALPTKKIGIINFDAHFDNRPIDSSIGATSGTGFWQIANKDANYAYLAIGIQENSNTKALFDFAHKNKTVVIMGDDFCIENITYINPIIENFISNIDVLYVTICLDVFVSSAAPGVSAPAYSGLLPDIFFRKTFKKIISSEKLVAFDIAELNPVLDSDNRTARLAASLIFEVINRKI